MYDNITASLNSINPCSWNGVVKWFKDRSAATHSHTGSLLAHPLTQTLRISTDESDIRWYLSTKRGIIYYRLKLGLNNYEVIRKHAHDYKIMSAGGSRAKFPLDWQYAKHNLLISRTLSTRSIKCNSQPLQQASEACFFPRGISLLPTHCLHPEIMKWVFL
jgi:hypothetical protein